jgi:hypothetical protein
MTNTVWFKETALPALKMKHLGTCWGLIKKVDPDRYDQMLANYRLFLASEKKGRVLTHDEVLQECFPEKWEEMLKWREMKAAFKRKQKKHLY